MKPCTTPPTILERLLFLKPERRHIIKVERLENLGSYIDFGGSPQQMTRMYRIAVHTKCLACEGRWIGERRSLFPAEDSLM